MVTGQYFKFLHYFRFWNSNESDDSGWYDDSDESDYSATSDDFGESS